MTELRPMWSTTMHPSEYDIDEQMRDFIKAANKAKECYYGIDIGKLWGLYTAYKEQADEITTLRAQLAEAREIIKPFTHESLSEQLSGNTIGNDSIVFGRDKAELTLGDFRAARAWYTKVTTA